MLNRRFGLLAGFLVAGLLVWGLRVWSEYSPDAWTTAKDSFVQAVHKAGSKNSGSKNNGNGNGDGNGNGNGNGVDPSRMTAPQIDDYFEQVFSAEEAAPYPFEALQAACASADWERNEAYLNCVGINAGMTTIVSQVKVCLKMAVETGSHLVLPRIPMRDPENLLEYNFLNQDAYLPFDDWFDAAHLERQLARACPRMKIVRPADLDATPALAVRHRFTIECTAAPAYEKLHSYFWVGRPYATFFHEQFRHHMDALAAPAAPETPASGPSSPGGMITVVDVDSEFMVFRLTDDPTGRDLRLWTELGHLVRFPAKVRHVVDRLLRRLAPAPLPGRRHARGYIGVHYRAENDSIWSSADHQLAVDLDALDKAWERFGSVGGADTGGGSSAGAGASTPQRPLVYLACGDPAQVEVFVSAAAARGWTVTHKWRLASVADANGDEDAETARAINALPFDFQGAIDMGVMLLSHFFIGLQGSAFSSTLGNHRDPTGRYRGSSLYPPPGHGAEAAMDDGGAHTHLFNDLDANEYACCL